MTHAEMVEKIARVLMCAVDRNGRALRLSDQEADRMWQTSGMRDYYRGMACELMDARPV